MKTNYKLITLLGALCFISLVSSVTANSKTRDISYYIQYHYSNTTPIGFSGGMLFNKVGFDLLFKCDAHNPSPFISEAERYDKIAAAAGKNYRLSYCAGATYKPLTWLMLTLNAGYGESGVYAFPETEGVGIKNKIKGLDAGVKISFIIEGFIFSGSYNTILGSKNKNLPWFNDYSAGIGWLF